MNSAAKDLLNSSHLYTDRFNGFQDSYKDMMRLASSMCTHPVKVFGEHLYKPRSITLYAPCGQCENCRNTIGNELVNRFYQDACELGHAYFITLTYPSFKSKNEIPYNCLPCFWHNDNYNSDGKNLYSPCLLYYPHVQTFFKYLRNKLYKDLKQRPLIEQLTTGELGHRFGRPHWHLLLISSTPITLSQIQFAWTNTIKTTARIDYEDLVNNGTLNARQNLLDNRHTTSKKNVKKCVKYVIKYCNKSAFETANTKRLSFALPYLRTDPDTIYNNDTIFLKTPYYEEKISTQVKDPLHPKSSASLHGTEELQLRHLYALFGTHHQQSSINAIGKIYALSHCKRFASGNKTLRSVPCYTPTDYTNTDSSTSLHKQCQTALPFPRYYSALTNRYKFRLCRITKNVIDSTQYHKITLSDYNALCTLRNELNFAFPDCTRPRSRSMGRTYPLQLEDLIGLGIYPEERVIRLLFPNETLDNRLYHHHTARFTSSVFYRYDTRTRYTPVVTYYADGSFFIGILSEHYDRSSRTWVSPRLCAPEPIFRNLLGVAFANQKWKLEYNNSMDDMDLFIDLMDNAIHSDMWKQCVQENTANWQSFKSKMNNQTKSRNHYD